MPFYQNPFAEEFRGNLLLGDRSYHLTYPCPPHFGRGKAVLASLSPGKDGIFNLSGSDAVGNSLSGLILHFAVDPTLSKFATIAIDCVGTDTASTMTVPQIVTNMNSDSEFSSWFTAVARSTKDTGGGPPFVIHIKPKIPESNVKFYVDNVGAETVFRFNLKSGIAELPTYFTRHTVEEQLNFEDGTGMLIELSLDITDISIAGSAEITTREDHGLTTGNTVVIAGSNSTPIVDGEHSITVTGTDTFTVGVTTTVSGDRGFVMNEIQKDVIENAFNSQNKNYGFLASEAQQDWELYQGGSGLFEFTHVISGVGAVSTTTIEIVYPAGARVGDLARKIFRELDGSGNTVNVYEIPYTLEEGDISSPP
jgi:hypothetical protein